MRTTLEIDDDVFEFARGQAQRERTTVGEMMSRLAREGIRWQHAPRLLSAAPKSKFALLPARDEVVTAKHVYDLMDQQGI